VKVEMKFLERIFNNQKQADKKESLGRNDLCWCGSGKKYKRCHLDSDAHKQRMKNGLGGKPKK
jgi:methionyl aminopeptidase